MAITKSKLAFEPKLFIRVALTKGSLLKGQLSDLFMLNNPQCHLSWWSLIIKLLNSFIMHKKSKLALFSYVSEN